MATIVNRRRGTTGQHAAFTGAVGETTYDTDKKVAVVHDGLTIGGFPLAGTMFANIFSAVQTIDLAADVPALEIKLSGVSKYTFYAGGFATGERLSLVGTTNQATLSAISSVTGASSASAIEVAATWNTTAAPSAFQVDVTNTASDVTSKLLNLRVAAVSQFAVFTTGNATLIGNFTANKLLLPNTTSATVGGIYFGGNPAFHNFGTNNIFGGVLAGNLTLTGVNNAVFGTFAGLGLTTGNRNSFIGFATGAATTTGAFNSFFGVSVGASNLTGINNSFFGANSAAASVAGDNNCYFGFGTAGAATGSNNIVFGASSANNLTTGNNNIIFGTNISVPVATGSNQMSLGNLIFGTGVDGTGTTISSGNVGIAVITPLDRLHIISGGAIRLGNAAVASGAVLNTHTLTIKDSAGTVYRLLCLV